MQKKRINFHKAEGFTLIEILVVLSILVIISSVAVVSFHGFDKRDKLRGIRDKTINDLQELQSNSLAGKLTYVCLNASSLPDTDASHLKKGICKTSTDCDTSVCGLGVPSGGFGIFFDSTANRYILFADFFNDGISGKIGYDANEALIDGIKILPSGIAFGYSGSYIDIFNNSGFDNPFPLQIIFKKDATTILEGVGYLENLNIKIQAIPFRDSDFNYSNVFVNRYSGLIYNDIDREDPPEN